MLQPRALVAAHRTACAAASRSLEVSASTGGQAARKQSVRDAARHTISRAQPMLFCSRPTVGIGLASRVMRRIRASAGGAGQCAALRAMTKRPDKLLAKRPVTARLVPWERFGWGVDNGMAARRLSGRAARDGRSRSGPPGIARVPAIAKRNSSTREGPHFREPCV
jgi:hypothetical protein